MNLKTRAFLEELSSLCVKYEVDLLPAQDYWLCPCIWVSDDHICDEDLRAVWSSGVVELSNREVLPQTKIEKYEQRG